MDALSPSERAALDEIMSRDAGSDPRDSFNAAIRELNERRIMRVLSGGGTNVRLIKVKGSTPSWLDALHERAAALMR